MTRAGGGMETDAAGFVLAGGQSSRMGQDKALLPFAGQPLIVRALSILREAGLEAKIAGARSALDGVAVVFADAEPGLGPLSGICAALAASPAQRAVFLPVDLPLLPPSLVAFLLHHAQITGRPVTLSSVNGFAQTFPAVIARAALPALQSRLESGRRGCFRAFQSAAASLDQTVSVVPVEYLVQCGQVSHPDGLPAVHWFRNLNSPWDLRHAQALARAASVPASGA
ncbi:MAG: molybdenum cofactor guanylyltransferase [Terracidiphilus sp.]